jgi:hypothetical protein
MEAAKHILVTRHFGYIAHDDHRHHTYSQWIERVIPTIAFPRPSRSGNSSKGVVATQSMYLSSLDYRRIRSMDESRDSVLRRQFPK